jgi:GGDEF domain-containing protein
LNCLSLWPLVSIDDFDELGEKFGAVVAESVICALGALIRGRFEPSVIKARWVERVFVLAFPDLNIEQAGELVDLLEQEFSEIEFSADDDAGGGDCTVFRVSLTAGFAGAPEHGIQFSQVRDHCTKDLIARLRAKVSS